MVMMMVVFVVHLVTAVVVLLLILMLVVRWVAAQLVKAVIDVSNGGWCCWRSAW